MSLEIRDRHIDITRWAKDIPEMIRRCQERWSFEVKAHGPGASNQYILFVNLPAGRNAVLKLMPADVEYDHCVQALKTFASRSCVELYDHDPQLGALLMEHIIPGTTLNELEQESEQVRIAARLMQKLCITPPTTHQFPNIRSWLSSIDIAAEKSDLPLPKELLIKAQETYRQLLSSSGEEKLIHGDLQHSNILFDNRRRWVSIDPKGVIADPLYAAARFLYNPWPELLHQPDPIQITRNRIQLLQQELKADPERLLQWAFVDAMLSACWITENNGEDWDYPLACANLFRGLLK